MLAACATHNLAAGTGLAQLLSGYSLWSQLFYSAVSFLSSCPYPSRHKPKAAGVWTPALAAIPTSDLLPPITHPAAEFDSFAFKEGEEHSLEEFEKIALGFERTWWGSEARAKKVSARSRSHSKQSACLCSGRVCAHGPRGTPGRQGDLVGEGRAGAW